MTDFRHFYYLKNDVLDVNKQRDVYCPGRIKDRDRWRKSADLFQTEKLAP